MSNNKIKAILATLASVVFSEEQLACLAYIVGLKSSARAEYIERDGLGEYNPSNPHIAHLISVGLLTVNKAGSITCDKEVARELLLSHPHPQKYSLLGINSAWMFQPGTHPMNRRNSTED